MLVFDAREKTENAPTTARMEAYLKGTYDDNKFKEEDHPRGGEGSGKGGQFVKSEKTKQKEDMVDNLGKPDEKSEGEKSKNSKNVDRDSERNKYYARIAETSKLPFHKAAIEWGDKHGLRYMTPIMNAPGAVFTKKGEPNKKIFCAFKGVPHSDVETAQKWAAKFYSDAFTKKIGKGAIMTFAPDGGITYTEADEFKEKYKFTPEDFKV